MGQYGRNTVEAEKQRKAKEHREGGGGGGGGGGWTGKGYAPHISGKDKNLFDQARVHHGQKVAINIAAGRP